MNSARSGGRGDDPAVSQGSWLTDGDDAATEPAAGHSCAEDTWDGIEPVDRVIHLWGRHIEIVAQAGVALGHDPAGLDVIATGERSGEVANTLILVDDVAGAASSDVFGDAPDIVECRQSERPNLVLGASALGNTVGVLGPFEGAMSDELDHHIDVVGDDVRGDAEAVAVNERCMPSDSGGDRKLVHDAGWHASCPVLSTLGCQAQLERGAVKAECETDRAFERGAGGQPSTGRNVRHDVAA